MINNLPLELAAEPSLDYLNGQPYRARVVLTNADGAYYPIFFEPEAISKPLPELLKMALDVVYNKNFSQRAEDERFNLMGTKVAEIDDAIEASKAQQAKMEEMMKLTSATLNEIIAGLSEEVTDEPTTTI